MNDKKIIILLIVLTIFILFGGVFVLSATTQNSPKIKTISTAKAYVTDPTSFDWGNIVYSGPKATKIFTIKNTGTDTLKLFNIRTSCHCTKAYITINGEQSPDFGMSGVSSWTGQVQSGSIAKLTVIFDQAFHGSQAIGSINRFVEVETNDSSTSKLTFTLTGNVVK